MNKKNHVVKWKNDRRLREKGRGSSEDEKQKELN